MRRRKGSRKGLNKLPGGCWQTTNQLRRLSSTPASPKSKSEHCNTKRTKELTLVLFIFRHSLLRRERQGCRRTGRKMPVRRHPAAPTGSEGPHQPTPRTLPTAPDGAGKRPQARARLPHRLTQQRQCYAFRDCSRMTFQKLTGRYTFGSWAVL